MLDHGIPTAVLGGQDRSCATCGYNLRGNLSGVCPECQTAVKLLLAAPRGTTPVVLLRLILMLLMAWGGVEAYGDFRVLGRGYSLGFPTEISGTLIAFYTPFIAALITLFWAGLVLLRSVVSGNGRLTDHQFIFAVLRVVVFISAIKTVLAVVYVYRWMQQ